MLFHLESLSVERVRVLDFIALPASYILEGLANFLPASERPTNVYESPYTIGTAGI